MLDILNLQLIKGDIVHSIKQLKEYVAHVQIAQAPYRHEPNADGELNYRHILTVLREEGYTGWIALEYVPLGDTIEGLKWINEFGYTL